MDDVLEIRPGHTQAPDRADQVVELALIGLKAGVIPDRRCVELFRGGLQIQKRHVRGLRAAIDFCHGKMPAKSTPALTTTGAVDHTGSPLRSTVRGVTSARA